MTAARTNSRVGDDLVETVLPTGEFSRSNPEVLKTIRETLVNTFKDKKVFTTSSFQTHSVPMLHILSQIDKKIPVYFLNTGYHFPETLRFRDEVSDLLGLHVVDLHPSTPKNHQRDHRGNLLFSSDPDYCCYLNKIQPLEAVLIEYDVWISGVRADQTTNRKTLHDIEPGAFNTIRYHPMLHWTAKNIDQYIKEYQLPSHPLDSYGYSSVGCMPCTRKIVSNSTNARDGRWAGLTKTECGLHTQLVEKR
jgi:phosphoadenosine phosphosulfate reductase